MTRKLFFLMLLIGSIKIGWGQSISPQVIGSSGKYLNTGGNSIEFTVGELVSSTVNSSGNIVTQGFHQTYVTSFSINETDVNLTIHIYPNPTVDWINVRLDNESRIEFSISIYDATGQKVLDQLNSNQSFLQVNISNLAAGTYFVTLIQAVNHLPIKTFKIQKLSNQ